MSIKFLKCFINFQIASPATYAVSAPVPSQLAYSAKISYQQQQQYMPQFLNEVHNPKQTTFRLFPQPEQPNIIYQAQASPQIPQVYHPQLYHGQRQQPYNTIGLQQPVTYFQQNLDQRPHIVPGIIYQQNENQQQPTLREFINTPPPNVVKKPDAPPAPAQVLT